MAAMPIYGKRTKKASRLNVGIKDPGLKVYQCSNDDPRLTFDLLTARSNLLPMHLYGENIDLKMFLKMY